MLLIRFKGPFVFEITLLNHANHVHQKQEFLRIHKLKRIMITAFWVFTNMLYLSPLEMTYNRSVI